MAYIYKITNVLNQKSYIGKTHKTNPTERFKEHQRNFKKFPERPLYRAFAKHGLDNFIFEIIEETSAPEEREIFWIEYYKTYGSSGYNATRGGDGKKLIDDAKIVQDYLKLGNQTEVAKINHCDVGSVREALKSNKIEILPAQDVILDKLGKSVEMISKETGEVLKTFSSQAEAGRYLMENGFSNIQSEKNLSSKISLVCRGKRKTCAGFVWRYSSTSG